MRRHLRRCFRAENLLTGRRFKEMQRILGGLHVRFQLGDGIETGIDWVQKGRQKYDKQVQNAKNQNMFYRTRTTTVTDVSTGSSRTTTSVLDDLVPAGYSYSHT